MNLQNSYIGLGGNYYFDKNNKGLYGGLGIGLMSFGVTETGIFNVNTFENEGTGDFSIDLTLIELKLGYRWIWGAFSLTPEVGYAIGSVDDSVTYTASFPDGSSVEETFDTADIPLSGGTIFAITVGFSLKMTHFLH